MNNFSVEAINNEVGGFEESRRDVGPLENGETEKQWDNKIHSLETVKYL